MNLESVDRMIGGPGLHEAPILQHIILHAGAWCAEADDPWFASRVIPRFIDDPTPRSLGVAATTLARAATRLDESARARLEEQAFQAMARQRDGRTFAAEFASNFVHDRERYRWTLDSIAEDGSDGFENVVLFRALSASGEDDLHRVRSIAMDGYERRPSRELAVVLGMASGPGVDRAGAARFGTRVADYFEYLSARGGFRRCSPEQLLVELRGQLRTVPALNRLSYVAELASCVPSTGVPALLVEQLNRSRGEHGGGAHALMPLLAATLAPHLQAWPEALNGLSPDVVAQLRASAPGDPRARRILAFCGMSERAETDCSYAEAPRVRRSAGPLDPWELVRGRVTEEMPVGEAHLAALRSPSYFVREHAAESLRRGPGEALDPQVSHFAKAGSTRERELAGELAPWTSQPPRASGPLRWDDSIFVREQAWSCRVRRDDLEAVEHAFTVLERPDMQTAWGRAREALASRAFSAHVRRGLSPTGGLSDFFASVSIGAVARLESDAHLRAWCPASLIQRRARDFDIPGVETAEIETTNRQYVAAWPSEPTLIFGRADAGHRDEVQIVDLRGATPVRSWCAVGCSVVSSMPGFALLARE